MTKQTLLQAVRAVGGSLYNREGAYSCYRIPASKENWFYDLRNKINFTNMFYGYKGDGLYFGVWWDSPYDYQ